MPYRLAIPQNITFLEFLLFLLQNESIIAYFLAGVKSKIQALQIFSQFIFFLTFFQNPLTIDTMRGIVLCERRYGMDIQLKRGLLDVCVLAAIKKEDSYGYQIIKDMKPYVEISESTLYPILRRLEASKLLTVHAVEHNGRLRKYYHITPAGLKRIAEFQTEWREIMSIYQFILRRN